MTLTCAELWGAPPWVIERDAPASWMMAAASWLREKQRMERRAVKRKHG